MTKKYPQYLILLLACSVSLLFAYMNTAASGSPSTTLSFSTVLTGLCVSTLFISFPILAHFTSAPNTLKEWFHMPKLTLQRCVIGVMLFLTLYVSTYLIYIVLNPSNIQDNLSFIALLPNASIGLIFFVGLFICILFPLAEELLYRGIILRSFPPMIGLITSTLLFALAHGINSYLFPILLIGWGLGLLALNTRSILPSFIFHATFNTTNFIFLFIK